MFDTYFDFFSACFLEYSPVQYVEYTSLVTSFFGVCFLLKKMGHGLWAYYTCILNAEGFVTKNVV